MLKGKHILIGVTGGIAAYKTATVIRLLIREGAEVKVIMTERAKDFITPLTLSTLSKNPVLTGFFDPVNGEWNSHVDLAIWADIFLVAPATANSLAKMAAGMADNLLVTTYLSARCPVFVAPSMDLDMLNHPATTINIETLRAFGNIIIEPVSGELASGLTGKGRMAEPEFIVEEIINFLSKKKSSRRLEGKRILINAGPTREALDPVRFISNYSSGKMGIALADSAAEYGAVVDLVLGPVNISPSEKTSQILAGFALETGNGLENAKSKLIRKNLDLIVLNSLGDAGAGFGHDTNMITIIDRDNNINKFELKSKKEAAMDILNKIILMIS